MRSALALGDRCVPAFGRSVNSLLSAPHMRIAMSSETKKRQTIFRVVGPNRFYTKLSNTVLADRKLSLECKGMLVSILMLPPNWTFKVPWFRHEFGLGRDKTYALIREATKRGYCRKVESRAGDGSMASVEYQFSDDPSAFPSGEPFAEKPEAGPLPKKPEVDGQLPEKPDAVEATSGKSVRIQITGKGRNDLEKGDTRERARLENGQIQLADDLHALWLEKFDGDGERLDLALIQVAGFIQPNSHTRSLETQVSSQLARIAADKRDRDRRYQAAADAKPARAAPGMTNFDRKIEATRRCRQVLRDMSAKEIAR